MYKLIDFGRSGDESYFGNHCTGPRPKLWSTNGPDERRCRAQRDFFGAAAVATEVLSGGSVPLYAVSAARIQEKHASALTLPEHPPKIGLVLLRVANGERALSGPLLDVGRTSQRGFSRMQDITSHTTDHVLLGEALCTWDGDLGDGASVPTIFARAVQGWRNPRFAGVKPMMTVEDAARDSALVPFLRLRLGKGRTVPFVTSSFVRAAIAVRVDVVTYEQPTGNVDCEFVLERPVGPETPPDSQRAVRTGSLAGELMRTLLSDQEHVQAFSRHVGHIADLLLAQGAQRFEHWNELMGKTLGDNDLCIAWTTKSPCDDLRAFERETKAEAMNFEETPPFSKKEQQVAPPKEQRSLMRVPRAAVPSTSSHMWKIRREGTVRRGNGGQSRHARAKKWAAAPKVDIQSSSP